MSTPIYFRPSDDAEAAYVRGEISYSEWVRRARTPWQTRRAKAWAVTKVVLWALLALFCGSVSVLAGYSSYTGMHAVAAGTADGMRGFSAGAMLLFLPHGIAGFCRACGDLRRAIRAVRYA